MARRTGRRAGNPGTRETILDAARERFAESGYDGTTIRQVATTAGVDPALVHHYFGSKDDLFLAATRLPVDPATMMPRIFAEGPDAAPERVLRTFLSIWESPDSAPAMLGVVRSAIASEHGAGLVREFFTSQIARRLVEQLDGHLPPAEVPVRASLVASQLFGLALTRYILRLPPMAELDLEFVVAAAAPTVRGYLFGDLPAGGRAGRGV